MSKPVSDWMDVLDTMERSLEEALARTPEVQPVERGKTDRSGPMQRLEQRLASWQACLDRAEEQARETEAMLAEEEAALGDCRDKIGQARELLETWLRGMASEQTARPGPGNEASSKSNPPAT